MQHVAVIGLGTMGSGIAQAFATTGCRVSCFDRVAETRESVRARIGRNLELMKPTSVVHSAEASAILARIEVCPTEEAVSGAEFVIEAVAEDLTLKRELFERLERVVSPQTILASNTSSLRLGELTSHLRYQERVVVAHWFNPAHLIPVVEVVPGPHTSQGTMDQMIDLLRRAGKRPIRLNHEISGFIVNRVQVAMIREVWNILEQGVASPEEIDAAISGSMGLRLAVDGPLEICDFGGLDIWRKVFENLAPEIRSETTLPHFIRIAVDSGLLGAKSGQGIFAHPMADLERRKTLRELRLVAMIDSLREL